MSDDTYLTFAQAARTLPNRPSPSTLYRWYAKGLSCGDTRIYLRAYAFGKKLYVKPSDLEKFAAEVAEAKRKPSPQQEHKRRESQIAAAEQRLQELGV